uniref:NADH-ubiquinone oxidoreductase chain 2 n=1 Tax=Spirobranchus giganteus TaxID=1914524 RepID=A0A1I9WKB3_9ANNE|nr:NADH dehydrogenase subunit 2 [Spirobranchus giganteus]APA32608.1 NADH dehydrogenase subunit 2 [Spirobranchus giganteus]
MVLVGLFSLSSSSLFVLWLLMEVGVVLFMGMIASEVYQSAESGAKFFLAQAFIGVSLLFIFQMGGWESSLKIGGPILSTCMLAKMGIAPFHFWVPNVTKNLSPESLFVLLSFQKLPGMIIFGWGVSFDCHMGKFLAVCGVISGILGHSYKDFNTVLAFSSMVTTVWLLVVSMLDPSLMIFCFLAYSGLLFFTLGALKKNNNMTRANSFGIWGLVLLAGCPGGPVFTMKWLVYCSLVSFGHLGEAVILGVSVVCVVPLYLSLIVNLLLIPKSWWYFESVSFFWVLGLVVMSVSFFWLPVFIC